MQVLGEVITIDPTEQYVEFEPRDWVHCPKVFGLMHHLPSQTNYFVDLPSSAYATPTSAVPFYKVEARLVAVPEGIPIPKIKEQTELGRPAIVVLLSEQGYWETEVVHADRPQDKIRRDATNKLIN